MLVTAKGLRDRLKKARIEEVEIPSGTTKLAEMALVSNFQVDKVINEIITQQTINTEQQAEGQGVRYMDNVKTFYLRVLNENANMESKLNDMYQITHDSCMMKARKVMKVQALSDQKQRIQEKMQEARNAAIQSSSPVRT
jgi:hypothetical protein